LSHTWGDAEVSYQEWIYARAQRVPCIPWGLVRDEDEVDRIKAKSGYLKICKACEMARRDGYQYLWVDTNCIDKTSSAELSEAINSMYDWYAGSGICYAYLDDVPPAQSESPAETLEELAAEGSAFRRSRWFTRGWTLQELIVPDELGFFSKDWTLLEARSHLASLVTEITSIPKQILYGCSHHLLSRFPVAQKMAWAARRKTTRVEDRAYSLLGIFGINMPLLYGEGQRAFRRLQEEILKRSTDKSIFVWQSPEPYELNLPHKPYGGVLAQSLLAPSPSHFGGSSAVSLGQFVRIDLISINNVGITFPPRVVETLHHSLFVAMFRVYCTCDDLQVEIGIPLRKLGADHSSFMGLHSLYPAQYIHIFGLQQSPRKNGGYIDTTVCQESISRPPLGLFPSRRPTWRRGGDEGVGVLVCLPLGMAGFRLQCSCPVMPGDRMEPCFFLKRVNPVLFRGILIFERGDEHTERLGVVFAVRTDGGGLAEAWGCKMAGLSLQGGGDSYTAAADQLDAVTSDGEMNLEGGHELWISNANESKAEMQPRAYPGQAARRSTDSLSVHSSVVAVVYLARSDAEEADGGGVKIGPSSLNG